jgi:hypothetical protein
MLTRDLEDDVPSGNSGDWPLEWVLDASFIAAFNALR